MRRLVLLALYVVAIAVLIALGATGTSVAAGDDGGNLTAPVEGEEISEGVVLTDHQLVGDEAHLTFVVEDRQRIIVTDAFREGPMQRESFVLDEGENTVSMTVTDASGTAHVTVDTGDVLYGVRVADGSSSLPESYGLSTVLGVAAFGGVSGVLVLTWLIGYVSNQLKKREDV